MSKEFDVHWENANYEMPSKQKISIARKFLEPAIKKLNESPKRLRILDAGCGDGVHALVLKNELSIGFDYIGVDISEKAIDACCNRVGADDRFSFSVGDITEINSLDINDIVISYGVVAYTSSPAHTIRLLSDSLRSRGLLLTWVYSPGITHRFMLKGLRFVCSIIGKSLTGYLANVIVYLMRILPISSGVNLSNSTFEQCKETVMVNIVPTCLAIPSVTTVQKWHHISTLELIRYNAKQGGVYVKN